MLKNHNCFLQIIDRKTATPFYLILKPLIRNKLSNKRQQQKHLN